MSLEKTEAIVLKAFNWSESSRTVVFFSLDFGRIALIDKGGRSMKSKRGRLIRFARLETTFYLSEKESRGYIRELEPIEAYSLEGEGGLGRLAYASAACELLQNLLPEEEPQRALYNYFVSFLRQVEAVDKRYLASLFLGFYLRLLSQLGYHPSLAWCASCGKSIEEMGSEPIRYFSPERGGLICRTCQMPGDYYISLSDESYRFLLSLQTASLAEAAAKTISFKEATGLMDALTKFVAHQTGLKAELKSLEFIEKLKNS